MPYLCYPHSFHLFYGCHRLLSPLWDQAERVHSGYQRAVADLPCGGYQVIPYLWVRRFFCPNAACERHLFAERLPELVQPYARKTPRLLQALRAIGLTAGGEGGARLAHRLHLPTSSPTLLRWVKMLPTSPGPPVRVLGADDWAWKRGQRYGTILVDLERHQVVDLLKERSSESFAQWLQAHPTVDNVTRCASFSERRSDVWSGILRIGDVFNSEEASHDPRRSAHYLVLPD